MDTVLVTGATSEIERATADLFVTEGWQVYATDVDAEGLPTRSNCRTAVVDVTDADDPAPRYPTGLPARLVLATRWFPRSVQDVSQRAAMGRLGTLERFRKGVCG